MDEETSRTRVPPRERSEQIQRARGFRNNPTPAEEVLWRELRKRQLEGRKFRRQCPLGSYFADFVCLSDRLIVELDGTHHSKPDQARHDRIRTMWLKGQKFRVLRFPNQDVLHDPQGVLATIANALRNPTP